MCSELLAKNLIKNLLKLWFILIPFSISNFSSGALANQTDMANIFRMIGWMQATCTFYTMGALTEDVADIGIQISLKTLKEDFSPAVAEEAKSMTLKKYPDCLNIIP